MRDRAREPGDATPTKAPGAWIAAVAMFAGAHAAWWILGRHGAWSARDAVPMAAACASCAAIAATHVVLRMRSPRAVILPPCVPASIAVAGAAAGALLAVAGALHTIDPNVEPCPVTLEGTVATHPRPMDEGCDRLARFIVREAGQSFTLAADTAWRGDERAPCTLEVSVRVAGLDAIPGRGARIRIRGWMKMLESRPFPGSGPSRSRATLEVESSRLITLIDAEPGSGVVRSLRSTANGVLVGSMPTGTPAPTVALAVAMTTGVRLHGLDDPAADFRIAGMSHVLAISGFNVAVLVSAASIAARGMRAGFRGRAFVAIAVAALFLGLTEPETSVLRAGWGAVIAAIASTRGGHARGLGTLGAVACVTMAIDVESARGAGFQLSYGTVAALLTLTPRAEARWRPRIDALANRLGSGEVLRRAAHAITGAIVASTVAWSVSTPIALLHMGSASGWAVALSIVTMPVAAMVTIAGCCAMAVGCIAGVEAAGPFGWAAATSATLLQLTAERATDLPGAAWWHGTAPGWWCCATLACAAASWHADHANHRRMARWCLVTLACASWCGWTVPHRMAPNGGSVEVIRLTLGQSTCTVVRSADAIVIVDPGNAMDPSAGTRRIVPALAELGVRRLDAVFVSRTRLACISAVPEVIDAFAPRVIMVRTADGGTGADGHGTGTGEPGPPDAPRRGAWGAVLAHARRSGVPVTQASPGGMDSTLGTADRAAHALAWAAREPDEAERALLGRSSAIRTLHAPDGTTTAFTWSDHGWRPAVTTTARRSSTQSPAMLPSSASMTSSKGASASSARSSNDASPLAMR